MNQSLEISDFQVMPYYTLLSVKSSSQDLKSNEHFETELSRVEIWLWMSSIIFAFLRLGRLSLNLLEKSFLLKLIILVLNFWCVGLNLQIACQVLAVIQVLISGQIFWYLGRNASRALSVAHAPSHFCLGGTKMTWKVSSVFFQPENSYFWSYLSTFFPFSKFRF